MIITTEVQQTITVVSDIICNKCGESCKSNFHGYEGLLEAEVFGGYGSEHVGDMNKHKFSMCEKCFMELSATFKIPSWVDDGDHFINDEEEPQ